VLVLSNLYPPDVMGGYELACAQAAGGLRARGHDLLVLASAPRQPVHTDPPWVVRRLALSDEWNPGAMGPMPIKHLLMHSASRHINAHNVYVLSKTLEEFRPNVVYVHNLVGVGGLGLVACLQFLGVPWVWHLGDCVPNLLCSERSHRGVVPELAAQYSRQVRGHYIVVSDHVREEVESAGIALNGVVNVIPYWINGPRPPARSTFHEGGPLRILSVGQVNHDKGVGLLIDAAGLLRDSGVTDFSVDIYGRPIDGSFAAKIGALGLEEKVRMMGQRPHSEILRLFESYDVLAFPTLAREPFGLVALEAASRGCVPLITDDCGAAEWLVHGVHCLKFHRSAESLRDTLRSVAERRTPLGHIGRLAPEAVWRDFHLDTVLPSIEATLNRAAGSKITPAGSADEAYRLARLAEQMAENLIQEHVMACS
jgi:glycosyltransferase involved in cell wall biosynthesis